MKKLKMIFYTLLSFLGLTILVGVIFLNTSLQFGAKSKDQRLEKIKTSPNYTNGKFKNTRETIVMKEFKLSQMLAFFQKGKGQTPSKDIPVKKLSTDYFETNADSLTRITWFGHSSLLLEMNGKRIFFDPVLSNYASPHPMFGEKRFNSEPPIALKNLPSLDVVLISHDHYDHLDYETITELKDRASSFYVPLGIAAHLEAWGVDPSKIKELDWWDQISIDSLTYILTPACYFSGRGAFDRWSTLWGSWVIEGHHTIYFSGDSGYDPLFKEIGNKYGPFDFAMIECGQYNPNWPEIHMFPEETAQVAEDLNAKVFMPIHWGAFKLALHEWTDPIERLMKNLNQTKSKLTTPMIGESIILEKQLPQSNWWDKVK